MLKNFLKIHKNLLKIVHWNILLGIKNFNFYDPFDIINEENSIIFTNSLFNIFNQNYSILYISDKIIFDCRKNEEVKNLKNINSNNYNLILSKINFNSANDKLLRNLVEENKEILKLGNEFIFSFPEELNYFPKNKISNDDILKIGNPPYTKFFTKKNADYLPQLILAFDNTELCLFGYPFTILENAEIINAGQLKSIDIIKYINIFEKFSRINKRYGK